jgi:hypothetical protein
MFAFECSCFPERSTEQCLCQGDIPYFLESNVVGIQAASIAGEIATTDALNALVCGRWFKLMMASA